MVDAFAVKQSCEANLIQKKNVQGVGVGFKYVDGIPTDTPAILVFVEKKYSKDDCFRKHNADDFIPSRIDGIATDVIEVGKIVPHSLTSKVRPIRPGYSTGHVNITAGTIGGFFHDQDGDLVALSNNHVFADENRCQAGDLIYQPGRADSGVPSGPANWSADPNTLPYFATLKKWAPLSTVNLHDSAIAKVHDSFVSSGLVDFTYPIMEQRMVGIKESTTKMAVQKSGRTTGHTKGTIMGIKASFTIGYETIEARFDDCIVCTNMSQPGDSGSIIFDHEMYALGLLFAGSSKATLASPMKPIMDYYGLSLPQ